MYTDDNDNKNNEENNIYNYVKNEEPKKEKKSIKKMFSSLFKKEEKNEEPVVDENFYNISTEEDNNSFIDDKNNMVYNNFNQEHSDNNNYEYNNETYNTEYDYDNTLDNQQEPYVENHTTNYHKNFNFKNIGVILAIILLLIGLIWFIASLIGNNNNDNKITTNLTSFGITIGKDYQLNALTSIGSYAKYETTDNNIISLNNTTGYITALKEGQTTVNILDKDNKVVETVTIYVVKNKIPVTNLEVMDNITINKNEKKIISLTLTPNNATEHNFKYTVADTSIINITNGIIQGINKGTTTINITNGTINKTITVTVK